MVMAGCTLWLYGPRLHAGVFRLGVKDASVGDFPPRSAPCILRLSRDNMIPGG